MNDLTIAALDYLERGHHLLALTGKRPNPRFHGKEPDGSGGWSWDLSIHGSPETAEDIQNLNSVFEHETTTGLAILIPGHFLVADVDTEEAAILFRSLVGDDWADTVVSNTPNGLHIWYFAPGADKNLWLGGRTLLLKGLGGYVAAPPSRHFDGNGVEDGVYEWIRGFETPMGSLSEALEERIKFERALDALHPVKTAESGSYVVVDWPKLHPGWHIDGLLKAIREAPDGNQNNMIAWAAMQARDEGVPYKVAMPLLLNAAIEGGHPRDRAKTTIKGAFTRAARG